MGTYLRDTTLAWLMDPDENHGFGDTLLRAFLKEVFEIEGIRRVDFR